MDLEARAVLAAQDEELKNELISEYQNFILSSASKVLKRGITVSDDEFMIAMLAFNEAIDSYDRSRGEFISFASMVIRSRIIDSLRRGSKHTAIPFSSLENENDDRAIIEFAAPQTENGDIKWEIEALTDELKLFDISFFELAGLTPKSRKTKRLCYDAIKYITDNSKLVDIILKKHILPIKEITDNIKSNRKTLERHRKYIITAVIVLTQDYPAIAGYFDMREV